MAALIKGFIERKPDKAPPRSGKEFAWPSARNVNAFQQMAFQKFFTNKLRERGDTHRDFARVFFGETKTASGYTAPKQPQVILEYADGSAWPTADRARQLAAFLKVPMEAMLVEDGAPYVPLAPIRSNKTNGATRKGNGHAGNGHAAGAHGLHHGAPALAVPDHAPQPPPPRPKGAKPAVLHVDAFPDAPDYCSVTITGTVRYDTAMALVNLMGRDLHGHKK
jgi:hypothetical protein